MAKNNTLVQTGDQAGWSKKLVVDHNVFNVNTTVNFKVSKAYFADGSELDAENKMCIRDSYHPAYTPADLLFL